MSKLHRCLLHTRCIIAKAAEGRNCSWHLDHLLREFGVGKYRQSKVGGKKCYT